MLWGREASKSLIIRKKISVIGAGGLARGARFGIAIEARGSMSRLLVSIMDENDPFVSSKKTTCEGCVDIWI